MNFGVNKGILIAGMVIAGTTILNNAWVHSNTKGVVKVLVGAYVFLIVLAFVDMIPGMRPVTTGLAMLAMLTTLLMYGGGILQAASASLGVAGNPIALSQSTTPKTTTV